MVLWVLGRFLRLLVFLLQVPYRVAMARQGRATSSSLNRRLDHPPQHSTSNLVLHTGLHSLVGRMELRSHPPRGLADITPRLVHQLMLTVTSREQLVEVLLQVLLQALLLVLRWLLPALLLPLLRPLLQLDITGNSLSIRSNIMTRPRLHRLRRSVPPPQQLVTTLPPVSTKRMVPRKRLTGLGVEEQVMRRVDTERGLPLRQSFPMFMGPKLLLPRTILRQERPVPVTTEQPFPSTSAGLAPPPDRLLRRRWAPLPTGRRVRLGRTLAALQRTLVVQHILEQLPQAPLFSSRDMALPVLRLTVMEDTRVKEIR